ncbi:MAG: hypothetical protein UY72_C0022G0010 [Candidatus Uhrbacteria bacterium GW2011_GWD2_52_7]|uniref:Uncharacterized protein n=1 Tax=Candidatus Uhrbacteria bacterium GW2011_GWD2_52_7 TaxID=1618989 RepID=A0A0G1XGR4_9BACT|nr:MAG: hypothetical protein UY72_C0022G0010 [Candidatus Uhrbacteria bacterium GW2011_GWD2_52_7]
MFVRLMGARRGIHETFCFAITLLNRMEYNSYILYASKI